MTDEQRASQSVPSAKDLDPPLSVVICDGYVRNPDNGGIVWFLIRDRNDRSTQVCIDGRRNSPTAWRLFEGARHPNTARARLVELGDEIEGIVIPLISQWLASGDHRQLGLVEWFYEMAQEAVTRIGEPTS